MKVGLQSNMGKVFNEIIINFHRKAFPINKIGKFKQTERNICHYFYTVQNNIAHYSNIFEKSLKCFNESDFIMLNNKNI